MYRDFFPVVLSFMRQLPVIGSFLSMPGVRQVSLSIALHHLLSLMRRADCIGSQVTDRICGVRQSPV